MRVPWLVMTIALSGCIGVVPLPLGSRGQESVPSPEEEAAAPDAPEDLRAAMLDVHNRARAAVDATPLRWSDALAQHAHRYALELARTGQWRHDPALKKSKAEGENLFMGTADAYLYGEMAQLWVDERRVFRPGLFPNNSSTGDYRDVAHYTQIIWPTTTAVGCAVATGGGQDYLVCRYAPPGNIVGHDPLGR